MDLSKLPKLSESPAPPQPVIENAPARRVLVALGIEYALVTIGIGLILLFFLSGPVNIFNQIANPGALPPITDTDGTPMSYAKSAFIWADLGVTLLAIALIVDGLASGLTRSAIARYASLLFAVACILINAYVVLVLKSKIGLQIFNAVAILAGVLIAVSLFRQLFGSTDSTQQV